jgi:phage FluMu gp28-like protein
LTSLRLRWRNYKQRRALRKLEEVDRAIKQILAEEEVEIAGPVDYARVVLGVEPYAYQAKLLEDKSKRIVACMGRQTGKTMSIAMKAIHFADINPKMTVLITAPSLRQSMIMFDRIVSFVYSSSRLRNKLVRITRTLVCFENGSRIIALPCSEHRLRGYSANMIICDEASWVSEKVITQVLFPMLTTTQGYAVFLSTPWDKNHFFYRAFINPQYSVHKVKSEECPLVTKDFLEEMRQNMTQEQYLMEYEAEFVEALNSYLPQSLIRGCVELAQKLNLELAPTLEANFPRADYYAGIDFGKLQDYSVIAIIKRENEILKLIYLYEFPLETPYTQVIGHLARANQKFAFRGVLVDQTGVGEPVLEEMHNQGLNNVKGITFTVQTKEELLTSLKIAMEQNRLAIPYHRQLCQQLNEQQYSYAKNGHLLFSHPINSHDDMTWALALAVAHCMQMPSQGVGAAMLPPSEKIPPLEKVKPLSSAPFWQAFISKIQQDGCQTSE